MVGGVGDYIIQMLGRVFCSVILVAVISFELVVIYTDWSLPDDIDKRSFEEYEGFQQKSLPIALVESSQEERQGRRVAVLTDDAVFVHSGIDHLGERVAQPILISRYFKSDFASIPFPANRLISPFGRHAEAAIVHDYLYAHGRAYGWFYGDNPNWVSWYASTPQVKREKVFRKHADIVFYEAMRASNVNWVRRRIMYAAVRIGGAKAFGRPNEWEQNFYDPELEAKLPVRCIPDEAAGFITVRSQICDQNDVCKTPQKLRYENDAISNAELNKIIMAAVEVFATTGPMWVESFQSTQCLPFLIKSLDELRDSHVPYYFPFSFSRLSETKIDPKFLNENNFDSANNRMLEFVERRENNRHISEYVILAHLGSLEYFDPHRGYRLRYDRNE